MAAIKRVGVGAAAVVAGLVGVANMRQSRPKKLFNYADLSVASLDVLQGTVGSPSGVAVNAHSLWSDKGAIFLAIRRAG